MNSRISAAMIATVILLAPGHSFIAAQQQGGGADQGRGAGRQGGVPGRGGGGGLGNKAPNLPAGAFTAGSTVDRTMLQHEWIDVPLGNLKLHTWIEYPAGSAPAPVVLVMSHEAGLDDWMRGIADQLALEGFIAVAPDILSGIGPRGGNFDAFPFEADVIQATARISPAESLRRYKAAYEHIVKLPRASGKRASLGVGLGGADSFRFAAETSDLNAAVVFYGISPEESVLTRLRAPVLGLYGEDDPRVMETVRAAEATAKRLGKAYEVRVFPGATQAFMRSTVEGQNGAAVAAAWPAAIQFLQQHLR